MSDKRKIEVFEQEMNPEQEKFNIYHLTPGIIRQLTKEYEDNTSFERTLIYEYLSHGIHSDTMTVREIAGALLLGDPTPDIQSMTPEECKALSLKEADMPLLIEIIGSTLK